MEDKMTPVSEMEQFHFGGKVFCSDGEEGVLLHLSIDPNTHHIVALGVRLGRFFGRTITVPFSAVTDAGVDGVVLSITREEAAADREPISGVQIDGRTTVQETNSGSHGTVSLVAVHPQSGLLAYVVARHLRNNQDALVLEQYIVKIEAGSIVITVPEATFQTLPTYRSDEELQSDVESVVMDILPLHVDFPAMSIRVLDSVLYLNGNISSSLRGDMVEDQAAGVQGLLEIKNWLIGDDQLAADLALALGRDARTRDLPIGVYPRLGVVLLSGSVRTKQQREAAEKIARSFAGVRSVENNLTVDPKADLLNVLSFAGRAETEDLIPGKMVRHTK
ncbi:hypothetical protein ccbrp13_59420 [Ktedonobacteria bacterium brp13]|nr:hypothetical protein ccbrp13_59420 [Ktedonobacteria bacterium brp13]